jgi:hypothetical protein
VFEAAGPRKLLFLGRGRCVEERTGRAPDDNGEMRTVLQFRLRFPRGEGHQHSHEPRAPRGERSIERQPRPFDPNTPPPSRSQASATADPAETAAKQEKANHSHHLLLSALAQALETLNWRDIEEIPVAIDLRAESPDSLRFHF